MSPVVQRLHRPTALVFEFFLQNDGKAYGYAIIQETDLSPGTVYTILSHLREGGLLRRQIEKDPGSHQGPARYYYTMTKKGLKEAESLSNRMSSKLGPKKARKR